MHLILKLDKEVARHEVLVTTEAHRLEEVEEATDQVREPVLIDQVAPILIGHQMLLMYLMDFNKLDRLFKIWIALSIRKVW